MIRFNTFNDALNFQKFLNAPERLINHHIRVLKTFDSILLELPLSMKMTIDKKLGQILCVVHDIGKIYIPEELYEPSHLHEKFGKEFLSSWGIDSSIYTICETHGEWRNYSTNLEESLAILSDRLWRGARDSELEEMITYLLCEKTNQSFWDIYLFLDSIFKKIATQGTIQIQQDALLHKIKGEHL
ncbi:HD domain-containing protein [Leptospira alstonii]|uniref:HD domain-containing protein n=1 Tax=Leptospira alstonii TaxID=28452 RepID=UPI000774D243|nr:HD domain-containing protein [Leptospira alstonii]